MIASLDVHAESSVEAAGGRIGVAPPATITVAGPGGEASVEVADVGRGDYVEIWCGDDWCVLVGEKGTSVLLARPARGELDAIGELDRLDYEGGYDPGGMHRVEFYEIPGGDVLVVHEFGVARVSAAGIVWQRGHDDITARVERIDDQAVWLESERDRIGYALADGHSIL